MAFDWKKCTVIMNNRKTRINDCWAILKFYEDKLTPNIYKGLCAYLRYMHVRGNYNKLSPELFSKNIEYLVTRCCNKKNFALVMKRDMINAEDDIINHIKKAIVLSSYKQIYNDAEMLETYSEYVNRKNITDKDIEDIMRGVIEL